MGNLGNRCGGVWLSVWFPFLFFVFLQPQSLLVNKDSLLIHALYHSGEIVLSRSLVSLPA